MKISKALWVCAAVYGVALIGATPSGAEEPQLLAPAEIEEGAARLRCADVPFFWCTGGVGLEERAALQHRAFTLCVQFAERSRPFIAGVSLRVKAANGQETLFAAEGLGPLWCAALPAGSYLLQAEGVPLVEFPPQQRRIEVQAGRLIEVAFLW